MVRLVALLRPVPLMLATIVAFGLVVLAMMYGSAAAPGDAPAETQSSVSSVRTV